MAKSNCAVANKKYILLLAVVGIVIAIILTILLFNKDERMRIRNKMELSNVLGINFENGKINDIWVHSESSIYVFFTGDDEIVSSGVFVEMELEHIIQGNIIHLERAGLNKEDIRSSWVHHFYFFRYSRNNSY